MLRRPGGLVGPRGNALRRTLLVGRGVGLRKLSGGLGGSRGPGFCGRNGSALCVLSDPFSFRNRLPELEARRFVSLQWFGI